MSSNEDVMSNILSGEVDKEQTTSSVQQEEKPVKETSVSSSTEDEELERELGPVDENYFPVDEVPGVKRFEIGQERVYEKGTSKYTLKENPDVIAAFVDVKESFAPEPEEKTILLKNDKHDNAVIKHVFGSRFGIEDFETLKKLTNPETFKKVMDNMKASGVELKVPVYRSSFEAKSKDENGDTIETTKVFYKFTNRHPVGNRVQYSEYYQGADSGFPAMPDGFLNSEVDPQTGTIKGKILSVNVNTNFKRFEVEFEPIIEDPKAQYTKHVEEKGIHSYLATYKFVDKNDEDKIDSAKRTRQAVQISSALGVADFSQASDVIGEAYDFAISSYNSKHAQGLVYRAKLAKPKK